MINFFKSVVILLSSVATLVVGTKCRQCKGKQVIAFNNDISEEHATDFFRSSIAPCATGNDYLIDTITRNGNTWTFAVTVWRYCGAGGSNYLGIGAYCYRGICVTSDVRVLSCFKTVKCDGHCDIALCNV